MPTTIATALLCSCCWLGLPLSGPEPDDRPRVILIVGVPGSPEYEAQFRQWADRWQAAAVKAGAEVIRIGDDTDRANENDNDKETAKNGGGHPAANGPDRDRLRAALAGGPTAGAGPLWVVLIGHGTFDGREAKFNLRGPDVTAADLAGWLAPVKRSVALIDCTSASGPFLNRLSGENRVIVTATRSGNETNFARLGQFLSETINEPRADLDKDGQVSLLEAFLTAASRVREYYKTRAQLATEHPLIDDNGDKLGTPADWFRGVRATRRARDGASADGVRAHQLCLVPSARERAIPAEVRLRRDEIERSLATLRDQKATMSEDAYYAKLEPLMVELARLYRNLAAKPSVDRTDAPRQAVTDH